MWSWIKSKAAKVKSSVANTAKRISRGVARVVTHPYTYYGIGAGGMITGVATGIFAVVTTATASLIGTLGVTIAAVGGVHHYHSNRAQRYITQSTRLTNDLVQKSRIAREQAERIASMQPKIAEIKAANAKIKEEEAEIIQLKQKLENAKVERDEAMKKQEQAETKNNELEQEVAELKAGGNGDSMHNVWHKKYYYTVEHMNRCLNDYLVTKLGGFQNNTNLLANTFKEDNIAYQVIVLPVILYTQAISQRLPLAQFLQIPNGKMVFPFLDDTKQHWFTAELVKQDKSMTLYLHDPRGAGQVPECLLAMIERSIIQCSNGISYQLQSAISPYTSQRQSIVDRISCGPIVMKEMMLRIQGRSLNRTVPYQFAASELVQQQTKKIKNQFAMWHDHRQLFLSNLGLKKVATQSYCNQDGLSYTNR